MPNGICQSVLGRNFSSSSISNHSAISQIEWMTNILSLFICFAGCVSNITALVVMFHFRGRAKLTHNKYLVNLAVADLLRTCFIPFTIIARMKRNFIFGKTICQLLPVIQGIASIHFMLSMSSFLSEGVSVSVDVFTLVCISVERYLAICHPFIMLKLKSLSYASFFNTLTDVLIWTLGFLTALPNFYMHDLCFLPTAKRYKCERIRLQVLDDRVYMVGLDGKRRTSASSEWSKEMLV